MERIEDVLSNTWDEWDLMIAHPPCTYLTVAGNKWFKPEFITRFPDRLQRREDAVEFLMMLANMPIPHIALENPIGIMSSRWRKPDQIIQPYQFGNPERKSTCLWLKALPKLQPTEIVDPNIIQYKTRKGTEARSRTFSGIADAMADQWGRYLKEV